MEPAGLYLHVPFCRHLCPYCDFAVLTGGAPQRERFVELIPAELALVEWRGPDFDTVYLGGGTPSALTVEQIGRLLLAVRRHLPVADDAWIALEANPEDVSTEVARGWRTLGISAVSLGAQSLDDRRLAFLGRHHDPQTVRRAAETCREAGFPWLSLDLIFGVPGQDASKWRRELAEAAALRPDHISCYQLTVEEGTVFGVRARRGELPELDDDHKAELFRLTHDTLAAHGYEAYEVSNFAAGPEHRSRHNQKYWSLAPYLGLGPSACSFDGDRRRWWNERRLRAWQEAVAAGRRPIAGEERLAPEVQALEALMLGLRRRHGVDLESVELRTGIDLLAGLGENQGAELARWGLELVGRRLVPTLEAMIIADAIARDWPLPAVDNDRSPRDVAGVSGSRGRPR